MVGRAAKKLEEIRVAIEESRDLLRDAHARLDTAIENFRNLETYAQPQMLLLLVGHDPSLVRQLLEAVDPYALRVAWSQLTNEQRQAILSAEAEPPIDADREL